MKVLLVLLMAAALAVLGAAALYVFAPARFAEAALSAERALAGLERKEIEIEGLRIVYLDSGSPAEPLVLVHGFGADKDNWPRVARHFGDRYRVIAPDLPGFGESSAPMDADYSFDAQVQRLRGFVQALGLTRAHFGGSSMGGRIVARYASLYPNEVASLWLVANAGVAGAPPSELHERLRRGESSPLIARSAGEFRQVMDFMFVEPPFVPDAVVEVLAQRAVAAHALREKQFKDLNRETLGIEQQIAGLPIPTHILWGEQDRALHVGAVPVLQAALPNASATIFPDVGHLPMLEAPQRAAQDYLAFREGLKTARR